MQSFIDEVIRYLGYGGKNADEETVKTIIDITAEAKARIIPKSVFGTFAADYFDFKSRDIDAHIENAESVLLFAATLGAESERLAAFYQKTDLHKAVIFDAVCNAFIEEYCDDVYAEIADDFLKSGKYINTRFSPGYGDFSIEYQSLILDNLNAGRRIGLSVNSSSLLLPQKSVTAVTGVFNKPPVGRARGCETCNMKDRCKMKGDIKCSKTADSL